MTAPTTQQLQEPRELLDRATPAPWEVTSLDKGDSRVPVVFRDGGGHLLRTSRELDWGEVGHDGENVTHWMSLPTPPTQQDKLKGE